MSPCQPTKLKCLRVLSIMKQGADEEVLDRGERDLGMRKRGDGRDECIWHSVVAAPAHFRLKPKPQPAT